MTKKKKQRTGLVAGIFVGLKILEIIAVLVFIFGLYYVGKFFCSLNICIGSSSTEMWLSGLFILIAGGAILALIICGLIVIIQANWDWAKKLSKVFKSKRS